MQEIWERIEQWYFDNAPEALENLQPGAREPEIQFVERRLGICFPDDVRESYRFHNGQFEYEPYLIGLNEYTQVGMVLLSMEDIVDVWELWNELAERRESFWSPKWIPLTSDNAGNSICLDYAKSSDFRSTKIIFTRYEFRRRPPIVSNNFTEFLERFATDLDSGIYVFVKDFGIVVDESEGESTLE